MQQNPDYEINFVNALGSTIIEFFNKIFSLIELKTYLIGLLTFSMYNLYNNIRYVYLQK